MHDKLEYDKKQLHGLPSTTSLEETLKSKFQYSRVFLFAICCSNFTSVILTIVETSNWLSTFNWHGHWIACQRRIRQQRGCSKMSLEGRTELTRREMPSPFSTDSSFSSTCRAPSKRTCRRFVACFSSSMSLILNYLTQIVGQCRREFVFTYVLCL